MMLSSAVTRSTDRRSVRAQQERDRITNEVIVILSLISIQNASKIYICLDATATPTKTGFNSTTTS